MGRHREKVTKRWFLLLRDEQLARDQHHLRGNLLKQQEARPLLLDRKCLKALMAGSVRRSPDAATPLSLL